MPISRRYPAGRAVGLGGDPATTRGSTGDEPPSVAGGTAFARRREQAVDSATQRRTSRASSGPRVSMRRAGRGELRLPPLHPGIDFDALAAGWREVTERFAASPPGVALKVFLQQRFAAGAVIYPPRPLRALELTPLAAVRVVILGQDPYHGAGQAHGLAFSVPDGVRPPPSLRNIFLELNRDLGCAIPSSGNLERWARQGVLLLNAVFTVEDGRPASHAGRGWEALSDAVIERLAGDPAPKVFMLWGAQAQAKAKLVADGGHCTLTANHPSPLSARRGPQPFLGCRHFSQANAFLAARGRGEIDWCGSV
jgi:uracil-DNA glycosylase